MLSIKSNSSWARCERRDSDLLNSHKSHRGDAHQQRLIFFQLLSDAARDSEDLVSQRSDPDFTGSKPWWPLLSVLDDSLLHLWPKPVAKEEVMLSVDLIN